MPVRLQSLLTSLQPQSYLRTPWLLSFFITLVVTLVTLTLYTQLPPVIPLFYSLPQQSQHLVGKNWVLFFPGLLFLITVTHLSIIRSAKEYQPLLLQLFSWTTVAVQALIALTIVRSMLLVT